MMFPYMYEAQFLVEEGATPEQVDRALTDFGMAMGMFAVDDMAGLDVAWRVRQELGHFSDPRLRRPLVADQLYEMGRLGQKTRQGLVSATTIARKPTPDPEVRRSDRAHGAEAGIARRAIHRRGDRRALRSTRWSTKARVALEEGFAQRASDIDVIYVNGYGFPALARRADVLRRPRRPRGDATIASRRSIASTARAGRRRRCSLELAQRAARSASSTARRKR